MEPPRSLGRRVRFAQLELVLEVAAVGNLGAAAGKLHMTRAGVSKSIKELEGSLGQVLFERSRSGMQLTAAGARVAKHAQLVVNELQHLTDEAHHVSEGGTGGGLLRVGLQPFVGEYVLPTVLARLSEAGSQPVVQLHEGRLLPLIERLLQGELDALLVLYAPRAVDGLDLSMLEIRPVRAVPMEVIASPAMQIAQRRYKWADLRNERWVLPPASTHQRRSIDAMFSARGSRPPVAVIESPSFATNVELAVAGMGIAVVPRESAARRLASGELRVLDVRPALPQTRVALIHRKVSAIYMDALKELSAAFV